MKLLFATPKSLPLHRIFFYLTLFSLPVQLGYHFWPSWAMVLGRRVDYLSPTLYVIDILVVGTILSWMYISVSHVRFKNTHMFFLALIAFFILANTYFSKNIPVAVYQWAKVSEFGLFALYIAKTKPGVGLITVTLSVSAWVSSVIAIIQFFLQHSIGGPLWLLGERTFNTGTSGIALFDLCGVIGESCRLILRSYATFPHPNVLAGFLVIVLTAITYILLFPHPEFPMTKQPVRNFFWITSVVIVGALITTFSRSAWFVAGLAILGLVMTRYTLIRGKICIGIALIAVVLFPVLTASSQTGAFLTSESVVVRNELNAAAVSMMYDNPLFGVGWGNFLVALPHYLTTRQIYFLKPVHNIYLLIFSQLGCIGVLIVCVGFFWLFRISRYRGTKPYSYLVTVLCIEFLLLGFTDHYFLTLEQGQLMTSLITGLVICHKT